jgi:hypothetical protein
MALSRETSVVTSECLNNEIVIHSYRNELYDWFIYTYIYYYLYTGILLVIGFICS